MPRDIKILEIHDFRGAWEIIQTKYQENFKELESSLNLSLRSHGNADFIDTDEYFHDRLFKNLELKGWRKNKISKGNKSSSGLGISHQGLSILTTERMKTDHSTWLIERIMLIHAEQLSELTVILLPVEKRIGQITFTSYGSRTLRRFMKILDKTLISVIPIPFIIVGYGISKEENSSFDFYRIESSPANDNNIIDKSIEFPPELYEAGRGILSYFGTYLNEQYADQKARVTIQQDDEKKTLRMTVESETGEKEVIERAYEEFRLIVSKEALPDQFTNNNQLILKLQSQLDIMEVNVKHEMRARMIAQGRTEELMLLLGKSLDQKSKVTIHNHQESINQNEASAIAKAKATATAEAQQNISLAIGGVAELKELVSADSAEARELGQLKKDLKAIKKEQDPEAISTSPAMSKFRRVLEKIKSGEGKLAEAIKTAENGYEVFKDVAGKYNKIAQWCGLPVVPDFFTK